MRAENRKPWSMYIEAKPGFEAEFDKCFFHTTQTNSVTHKPETMILEHDNAITNAISQYMQW